MSDPQQLPEPEIKKVPAFQTRHEHPPAKAPRRRGVLLANLGTPDSPDVGDVRRYLGEFLMDRHVLDVPWVLRKLIVNCFILPFRPKNSAEAYASIWRDGGSPLLLESEALQESLMQELGDMPVALGMRYGEPSLARAVEELKAANVEEILLVPLYPQHAASTRTTCIEAVEALMPADITLSVVPPFFAHADYISALAATVRPYLEHSYDHLLLSYHGLPERHLTKADPTGNHCLQSGDCCEQASRAHATCYRHQVFETSRGLRQALGLSRDQVTTSFQSRLGRLPWLTPYTDAVLKELPGRGVRKLLVACPAFVADNLETLEEIGIQGEETFIEAGGDSLELVPCLNADPRWVATLARWCRAPGSEQPLRVLD
ncbi:MAG: ferrochelatase [Pseudomonadota bacterium]